jgi:peptidoglycan/xylan/chitin deacetylase (PgdA/CDA1 family)
MIDSKRVLFTILFLLICSLFNSFSPIHVLSVASGKKHTSHGIHKEVKSSVHKGKSKNHHVASTDQKSPSNSSTDSSHLAINTNIGNKTDKVVILTFGDTKKSQFTNVKPILDQYGYKASFFITCKYANDGNPRYHLNWNDILALQNDGQDIESKGMTPIDLNNISSSALNYQIGGSKQCLESHGIKSPNWFAAKYGDVWNNATVVNAISKYYQFADDGSASLMFLHCDGYPNSKQTDCRTYDDKGNLNYANAYSVREWNHNALDRKLLHNDQLIFQKFVQVVNSGISFNNKKGIVDAIPVVAYHIVDNSLDPSSTDINLFAAEMKYLHDNGFDVIPMSGLGYDQTTNLMYVR